MVESDLGRQTTVVEKVRRRWNVEEGRNSAAVGDLEKRGGLRLSALLEAKIVDPVTGEILSPGQRGELWLRGPTVMKGYAGDEKATAEVLDSDGWLKTGDLCYFDFDGSLFILDRLKEMIKCNSYQVVPAELEHLLLSNSDIVDAAVVPYPDEDAGQIPMAFVVRKHGTTITETQVMDFIAKQA
ncbi:hypothetical protein Q3G72_007581 [Acer saccharum]|nr:hypothetical protein Q3G72_007581 [Acer saccharum]